MLADATQCYTVVHCVRPSYLVLHPIRKKLRRDLSTLFPASERLLPPKCSLVTARLVTHGGDTVTVFMVDGEPLFFDDDGTIFPTGMYRTWMHDLSSSNWCMTDESSTFWHFVSLPYLPPSFHSMRLCTRCALLPFQPFCLFYQFSRGSCIILICSYYDGQD